MRFIRYDSRTEKPQVQRHQWPGFGIGHHLRSDPQSGRVRIECDLLVLSRASFPQDDAEELAKMLKVSVELRRSFFLEAHMKLRPVDFATDGVFMCGWLTGPRRSTESDRAGGRYAASRAATILSQDEIDAGRARPRRSTTPTATAAPTASIPAHTTRSP